MLTSVTFPLKHQIRAEHRPERRPRMSILAKLREGVMVLRTLGYTCDTVARMLRIDKEDVRDLTKLHRDEVHPGRLPRRAINALLNGRYAHIGGKTVAKRARHLAEIATAYSIEELIAEPGIGQVTALEITLWLESKGLTFRRDDN